MFRTCSSFGKEIEISVLVCGLQNAGKTTLIRRLSNKPSTDLVPTLGRDDSTVIQRGKLDIKLVDTSGNMQNIVINDNLYDCHGIFFVFDSSKGNEAVTQSSEFLKHVLNSKYVKMTRKPVLVIANKQDKEETMDSREIYRCLELDEICQHRSKGEYDFPVEIINKNNNEMSFPLFLTSAKAKTQDKGLKAALKFLEKAVLENWSEIDGQVSRDKVEGEEAIRKQKTKKKSQIMQRKKLNGEIKTPSTSILDNISDSHDILDDNELDDRFEEEEDFFARGFKGECKTSPFPHPKNNAKVRPKSDLDESF